MFKKEITVNPIEKESRFNTPKYAYRKLCLFFIVVIAILSFLVADDYSYMESRNPQIIEMNK